MVRCGCVYCIWRSQHAMEPDIGSQSRQSDHYGDPLVPCRVVLFSFLQFFFFVSASFYYFAHFYFGFFEMFFSVSHRRSVRYRHSPAKIMKDLSHISDRHEFVSSQLLQNFWAVVSGTPQRTARDPEIIARDNWYDSERSSEIRG